MALSVVSTRLSSLWVFAALFFCILHCTDPSLLGKMVLEGGRGPVGGLGNAQKGGSRDGREGFEEGQMKGGGAQSPSRMGGQVFCGGGRTQSCHTGCGSWSMPTQQKTDRGIGSISSSGRLSDLPMTGSSSQLWEEVSCGLAGPS